MKKKCSCKEGYESVALKHMFENVKEGISYVSDQLPKSKKSEPFGGVGFSYPQQTTFSANAQNTPFIGNNYL